MEHKRIGILGGSFDPVHVGHLWMAEAALEALQLQQVRWIPAATSPLKPAGTAASDQDRLQMLRLAVSGCEPYVVDDCEIERSGTSYTVDTLRKLTAEYPGAEWFLIIGSDSLASFRQWHQGAQILQLATLAVVQRSGGAEIDFGVLSGLADPERIERCRAAVIPMPLIEISSTELRSRIAAGRSIRFRVPHAVRAYIDAAGLYR